ncbi:MAG: carboxypeptidase regulatory-like domain-containing protein [Acidiferrobacterales bacterium]
MKVICSNILSPICIFVFASSCVEAASYTVLEDGVDNGGTVRGRIILNGSPPPPKMLTVDEDVEVCGDDRPSEELVVSDSGGIKNVVLSIDNIQSGKDWSLPDEFVYDQDKCKFNPRVLLLKPKASGIVLNSDPVGHNFHTISSGIYNVNKKMRAESKLTVAQNKIRRPGIIRAKCDIHSWMKGWWIVARTPYTVLSDEHGNFSITDIPPGTYTLKIWHEILAATERTVVIKAGETTETDVTLEL